MSRQPRQNPRRHIDQQAAEATRAIAAQRESVILPDHALNEAAAVRRPDINAAVLLWEEANRGTELEHLFSGPAREDERDG